MKLRNLFEARAQSVGIIFGRFNPPHKGHRRAWEMASENDAWFVGTNQSTQGPKDPLPYGVKIEAMKMIYPEIEGHIMPEQSWLTMASRIYEKYGDIVLKIYTDEEWVVKTIIQYNGKEGAHGFYNFKTIDPVGTPRLSSATELRNAVAADDRAAFSQAAGIDADTPLGDNSFFDVVKHYLTQQARPVKKEKAMKVKEYKGATDQERIDAFKKQAKDMRDKGFVRAADDTEKVAKNIYKKPQEKVKAKADEGRFGRNRDDQFSLGGRMPRTDRIDRDSSSGQDREQAITAKMKQQTINRLLDRHPEWERSDLELASLPELIQMLREAVKKPNATTRHLRDYPVSDKDVAKPVKPEKKKDEKKAVAEGSGKNVIKSVKVGNFRHDLVDTGFGWQVRIYNGDELYDTGMSKNSEQKGLAALDDAVAYTKKQLNIKEQGVAETSLKQRAKTTLRKLDPTIKGRLKDRADDEFDFGLEKDNGDWISGAPGSAHMKHAAHLRRLAKGEKPFQDKKGVAEGVAIVKQDYDLDQMVYVLDVDGNKVSFTYWDYEDDFNNPDIKDIYQQAQEQLGKKLSPEQVKEVARAVFKSFEQGVAEGSLETDNMVSHIGQVIQGIYPRGGDKKTYMKLVAQEMPRIVKANPKLFRRAFGMAYDRFFHIDQDDDFDYTDYSMRQGERGLEEGSKRCPQCGSTNCTCAPGKCDCKPVKGWLAKKEVDEAKETKVPQKPRQGPLRPQTGAGRHQDKKKDMKQGKEKHKKPLAEAIMDSMLSELDRPSGKLYIVIKGDPTGAVRMFGAFANSPEEVEFIAQRRGTKDKSGAKMKGLKVDLMFLDAADAMMDLRRIFKDIDFVGAEAAEFVFKNSAMNNDEVDPRVQEELKDFLEYVESGDDPRMAIYQEKEVGNEPDRVAKGVDHFVVGPDGKRRRVPIPGKPNSQMGGHAVEQPDTYKYVLKQPNLANALRSMGFNFDGNKIIIPQDKRKMLQAKFAAKNIPWDSVFGAKEMFKESK